MLLRTEGERQAMSLGSALALDIFKAWRGERDGVNALILLAITRSNADGVLYSRELRSRFGGPAPIAPDELRQPVSVAVLALSLGLRASTVSRRVQALASRNECQVLPGGMLITEDQIEASDRLGVVTAVYELLRLTCIQWAALGLFPPDQLPPLQSASAKPVRSAGAHAAKYVLQLLATVGRSVGGDALDGLLMLCLIRGAEPVRVRSMRADTGLASDLLNRRLHALAAGGFCRRTGRGQVACDRSQDWFRIACRRNMDHLYQLLAGLAEVGALGDFGHAV